MSAARAGTEGRLSPSHNAQHEADGPAFGIRLHDLKDVPRRDLYIRFAFGAAISTAASIIGLGAGSRIGGIFLAFPAILPATLTLIEKEHSVRSAENDDLGSILGAAALAVFGGLTWFLVRHDGAPIGLSAAALAWLATAVALYLGLRHLVRWREGADGSADDGHPGRRRRGRRQDPRKARRSARSTGP